MPTIRLATDDDMRSVTSQTLDLFDGFPRLYIPVDAVNIPLPPLTIPTEGVELMRSWGPFVARADLLYHGAEPSADFISAS